MATVGSIVRAPLPGHPKVRRKAVVATIQDNTASILWEDDAPRSILPLFTRSPTRRGYLLSRTLIVAPFFGSGGEENEATVSLDVLEDPLEFERGLARAIDPELSVEIWKGYGDDLLRLGDAAAAVNYYDHALKLSSVLQIGASVLVKAQGFAKVALVDCIDEDGTIDVSMATTEEEASVKEEEILVCIQEPRGSHIQEKLLLNIARCLLQLSEVTFVPQRRPVYLKKAVLCSTLVLSILEHFAEEQVASAENKTEKAALLLRSKAQMNLSKFQHADRDLKRLMKLEAGSREAQRLYRELEKLKKADKKLVKDMCRWVQNASKETVSENPKRQELPPKETPSANTHDHAVSSFWMYAALIVCFSILLQNLVS